MSDEQLELILLAQSGNRIAMDRLCGIYDRFIHATARKVARPQHIDHDDLVQEGLRAFIQAVHRFKPEYGFTLLQFVANQIRQAMWTAAGRVRKTRTVALPDALIDTRRDPLEGVIARIDFSIVSRALTVLDTEALHVFQRRSDGATFATIAEELGTDPKSVWRIAEKARNQLLETVAH